MINFSKIKLIIWDLDDTFWKGTLSEGDIIPIKEHIELIKKLSTRGIINSICSKNDFSQTICKLQELAVAEYFVFPSVNWDAKGNRISRLIKDMGLRPINCLFIDDNVVNLNEAKFYSQELQIAEPDIISELIDFVERTKETDYNLERLMQYRVLETKHQAKSEASDNMSFLYASNTQVELHEDCSKVADRLFEMIHRTNQLNFTKNRCSRDEFDEILEDKKVQCGYATVKDNFGDYGIVGFYAIKDNVCLHFLFSCRTIGQGIEQWVYTTLGCPKLNTIDPVVNHVVEDSTPPLWINQKQANHNKSNAKTFNEKIVFKGPCDLEIISVYLEVPNLIREFTYVGKHQASVEHHNHSVNYLRFPFLTKKERDELLNECIFNEEGMFDTHMYDEDTTLVFLSTLIDANLGVYKRKRDGYLLAYGEWTYPLTNEENWPLYVDNKIYTGGNHFTVEWLSDFREKYDFIGRLSPSEVVKNIERLLDKLPKSTSLCLMLGSETPYNKNKSLSYVNREVYHKTLNEELRLLEKNTSRLFLIDLNDYIQSQDDFTNYINHFQRRVYFDAAKKTNVVITQVTGKRIKEKGTLFRFVIDNIAYIKGFLNQITLLQKIARYVKSRMKK